MVSSELSIDLDESFLVVSDLSGLVSVEGILESLLEEDVHWDALPKLVWALRWSSGVDSLQLSKIP